METLHRLIVFSQGLVHSNSDSRALCLAEIKKGVKVLSEALLAIERGNFTHNLDAKVAKAVLHILTWSSEALRSGAEQWAGGGDGRHDHLGDLIMGASMIARLIMRDAAYAASLNATSISGRAAAANEVALVFFEKRKLGNALSRISACLRGCWEGLMDNIPGREGLERTVLEVGVVVNRSLRGGEI